MSSLQDIKYMYNLTTKVLYTALEVKPNNLNRYYTKDIKELSVQQLINLHNATGISYNDLLSEKVFTPNNIEDKPSINILDNTSQNNRTFEELKDSIKNELKVELLEELKELNKK